MRAAAVVFILLLTVIPGRPDILESIPEIDEVFSLLKTGLGVVDYVIKIWRQTFGTSTDVEIGLGSIFPSRHKVLLKQFQHLSDRLDGLQTNLEGLDGALRELQHGLPSLIRWELTLQLLENYMRPINIQYQRFRIYQENRDNITNHTLLDFAENAVSHDIHSTQFRMEEIYSLVVPSSLAKRRRKRQDIDDPALSQHYMSLSMRKGVFDQLVSTITASKSKICELRQSPQQLAYGLYTLIALTQARGFAMLQFSWILLRLFGRGDFDVESRLSQVSYDKHMRDIVNTAKQTMLRLSNEYWRCDPLTHVEGTTYVQLTQLLQGYIENEVDMNNEQSCGQNCASYSGNRGRSTGCYKDQFCAKQNRCRGAIQKCQFIDADATVCISKDPHRRYDWIEYENGQRLGRKTSCTKSHKVDSWWRYLFWHCSYCFCLCDDPARSNRHFSLRPSVSDVTKNMIVTGVHIVKIDGVIHLQIKQGHAEPFGQVNHTGATWKTLPPLDTHTAKDGVDYLTLNWQYRAIDLDDVNAPDGHVVTGVSFRNLGGHVNFEVEVTPISFQTGEMAVDKSYWISNDNTPANYEKPRTRVNIYDPDVPTRSARPSWPDSTTDTYIQFCESSMNKDASQLTVPFLDAQPVAPEPAIWLTGVGLYHKGQYGYGGFVGVRVRTMDTAGRIGSTDEASVYTLDDNSGDNTKYLTNL